MSAVAASAPAPSATRTAPPPVLSYAKIAQSSTAPNTIEPYTSSVTPPSPAKVVPASGIRSPYSRPPTASNEGNAPKSKSKSKNGKSARSPVGSGATTPNFHPSNSNDSVQGATHALGLLDANTEGLQRRKGSNVPPPRSGSISSNLSALAPSFSFNPSASSFSPSSLTPTSPLPATVPSPALEISAKTDSTEIAVERSSLESLVEEVPVPKMQDALIIGETVIEPVRVVREEEETSTLVTEEVVPVDVEAVVEPSVEEPVVEPVAIETPEVVEVEETIVVVESTTEEVIEEPAEDQAVAVVEPTAVVEEVVVVAQAPSQESEEVEVAVEEEQAIESEPEVAAPIAQVATVEEEVAAEVEEVVVEAVEASAAPAEVHPVADEIAEEQVDDAVLPAATLDVQDGLVESTPVEDAAPAESAFPAEPIPYLDISPPAPHRADDEPPLPPSAPVDAPSLTLAIYTAWNMTTWQERIPALLASLLINVGLPFVNGVFLGACLSLHVRDSSLTQAQVSEICSLASSSLPVSDGATPSPPRSRPQRVGAPTRRRWDSAPQGASRLRIALRGRQSWRGCLRKARPSPVRFRPPDSLSSQCILLDRSAPSKISNRASELLHPPSRAASAPSSPLPRLPQSPSSPAAASAMARKSKKSQATAEAVEGACSSDRPRWTDTMMLRCSGSRAAARGAGRGRGAARQEVQEPTAPQGQAYVTSSLGSQADSV